MEKVNARALSLQSYMRLFLYLGIFGCIVNWIILLFSFTPFFNLNLFLGSIYLPRGWIILFYGLIMPVFTIISSQVSSFISYWPYRLISRIFKHNTLTYIPLEAKEGYNSFSEANQYEVKRENLQKNAFEEKERTKRVENLKNKNYLISANDPKYQEMKNNRD